MIHFDPDSIRPITKFISVKVVFPVPLNAPTKNTPLESVTPLVVVLRSLLPSIYLCFPFSSSHLKIVSY